MTTHYLLEAQEMCDRIAIIDKGKLKINYDMQLKYIRGNNANFKNGDKYKFLREWHLNGNFPANHKCANRCDQTKLHQVINRNSGGTEK